MLERHDPEILLLAPGADGVEPVLELLADVPAGKLAIGVLWERRPTSWPSSSGPAATPSSSVPSLPRPDAAGSHSAACCCWPRRCASRGSGTGCPFPLLNPDEESIVPRAWAIGHGDGLDPGWYDYPSLLFYVLAPFEALVSEPSYGSPRALAAALGIAGVGAAWWLGRVAYGEAAGLVAGAACAVATVHVAYSHMAVTDVPLTAGVTVTLALLVAGRLEWAGVAAGLASRRSTPASSSLPLLVAGWAGGGGLRSRCARRRAFVVTSPFVVLHAGAAGRISRVQRPPARAGSASSTTTLTPIAFVDRLWESLGPCSSSRWPASCSPWTSCSGHGGSGAPTSCSRSSSSSTSSTC